MEFVDQLNRPVSLPHIPKRIISLVPSQTELLVDLGLRNKIVGVTKFCVHPVNLRASTTVVGGTKKVDFEKITSLNPDVILCNKEENTKEMVAQLEKIAPVWISDIENVLDTKSLITAFGDLFEVKAKAAQINTEIDEEFKKHQSFVNSVTAKKVLYLIWKGPYMAAGKQTFIDSLLQLNKFENVISQNRGRYPEVKDEDFNQADVILLSTEPYPFKKADAVLLSQKFKKEVKLVDGEYYSWYGSRLAKAFGYFKTLF
ncbi:MAG: cobalamin-binding protein [Aequorivita sp.]|nr:cobalamin-binding protein [Aequorivita sp.]|tara:strand:+ start:30388 stop:31161 length:774 start_codon:yes stop_codon:yes gene_type:complete